MYDIWVKLIFFSLQSELTHQSCLKICWFHHLRARFVRFSSFFWCWSFSWQAHIQSPGAAICCCKGGTWGCLQNDLQSIGSMERPGHLPHNNSAKLFFFGVSRCGLDDVARSLNMIEKWLLVSRVLWLGVLRMVKIVLYWVISRFWGDFNREFGRYLLQSSPNGYQTWREELFLHPMIDECCDHKTQHISCKRKQTVGTPILPILNGECWGC